ncbi:MAG: acyl-CoA dehydrogenase family protein [Janthinobacterium lividum]
MSAVLSSASLLAAASATSAAAAPDVQPEVQPEAKAGGAAPTSRSGSANASPDWLARAEAFGKTLSLEAAARDTERRLPHAELAELARSGLLSVTVPAVAGGPGVSASTLAGILIQLAAGDPNVAQAIQPHFCGIEKLRIYGTARQRAQLFGTVLEGTLVTNASAEKHTPRVGDIQTRLSADGEAFRLDGNKAYNTGSLYAQYLYVLAGTPDGGRAIAWIPVARDGLRILDDWDGMGQRTTASGSVVLERVIVSADEVMLLPPAAALRTYEGSFAQLLHAAIDAGIALAAFADATHYGRTRARPVPEAGVARASEDPYVLHAVGEMATLAHGAVAMVNRAAAFVDAAIQQFFEPAGAAAPAIEVPLEPASEATVDADTHRHQALDQALGRASVAVAEAKMAANEASLRVSEMLYRVGGASATSRSLNLDRHWRNARTHTTHDPVAYKARAIGDFYLNDRLPPITTKI